MLQGPYLGSVRCVCRFRLLFVCESGLMVSFSANMEPPDANMEPPDEGTTRRPRAMTEMIFLAIALLVGMMTVPCFRASVVQRRIAFEGFPLACLVLLTSVLVTLASTSTFPILSVPHVPFVTILPPAPRSSTPCMPHSRAHPFLRCTRLGSRT